MQINTLSRGWRFFFFLKSLAELFLAAFLERHSYSNALPALIKLRDLSF